MTHEAIWCETGKLQVTLPDEAFDQSLLSNGAQISPCEGCQHTGHSTAIKRINREVADSKLLTILRKPNLSHRVQVLKFLGKMHVQCSCCCYTETIK